MEILNFKKWLEVKQITTQDVSQELAKDVTSSMNTASGGAVIDPKEKAKQTVQKLAQSGNATPAAVAGMLNVIDTLNQNNKPGQQTMSKKMRSK